MLIVNSIKFDKNGLVPCIVQDFITKDILMLAYMNKEALTLAITKKQGVFYSRSRNKIWFKGEQSGYNQVIKEILTDCDKDVVLIKVEQKGGITCHTGRKSCFFNTLKDGKWLINSEALKDPKQIYGTPKNK